MTGLEKTTVEYRNLCLKCWNQCSCIKPGGREFSALCTGVNGC